MAHNRPKGKTVLKKLISLLLAAVTVSSLAAAFAVPTGAVDAPEIKNAASAYLYNIENSQAIYTYNPEEKVYPTSTVKIMTGIVALEELGLCINKRKNG